MIFQEQITVLEDNVLVLKYWDFQNNITIDDAIINDIISEDPRFVPVYSVHTVAMNIADNVEVCKKVSLCLSPYDSQGTGS